MKSCPKCSLNYSDETLEFCLEDGSRLIPTKTFEDDAPTVTRPQSSNYTTAKTANLPFQPQPNGVLTQPAAHAFQTATSPSNALKENVLQKSNRALEIIPIILALAHNWWQWIYLNNQSYSTFVTYFFSANFLMWLLLLILGAAAGMLSIKRAQNKNFAVAGLVVLAINLILFLVPKR